MLISMHKELIRLLEDAGWQAWAEDAVPPEATFPLVTCRVSMPLTWESRGEVVLTGWTKGGDAQFDRLTVAEKLLSLFPRGGSLLVLEDCVAALFPDMNAHLEWPQSDGALGFRFRLSVMAFPSHKGG